MLRTTMKTSLLFLILAAFLLAEGQKKHLPTVEQLFNVQTIQVKILTTAKKQVNYGYIVAEDSRKFDIHAWFSGYVTKLFADTLYKKVEKGENLAQLGNSNENGNYAPHLHFQIIEDIGDYQGDYPGVSDEKNVTFYKNNCPNPNLILGLE